MYKKILIGIENLKDAQKALNKVLDFYKTWNTKIVVFHTVERYMKPVPFPGYGMAYYYPGTLFFTSRSEYYRLGSELLEKTEKMFEKAGISIETRLIEDIKPEDYAREKVREEHFDLVMIGEKEHHSILDTLLGSSSTPTHIINDIDSDVLILH